MTKTLSASMAVVAAVVIAAGSSPGVRVAAADDRVQALFDLYERGDYAAFDRSVAGPKDVVDEWRDVEREATIWLAATPDPAQLDRRRLVAASVGLELAYVHRENWTRARALIEGACRLLHTPPPQKQQTQASGQAPSSSAQSSSQGQQAQGQAAQQAQGQQTQGRQQAQGRQQGPGRQGQSRGQGAGGRGQQAAPPPPPPLPQERFWHLAAASLAQSVGDYNFFLPENAPPGQPQGPGRGAAPSGGRLNHGQHALARFQDEAGLHLALAIALETEGLAMMTNEDLVMWVPPDRVDRMLASSTPMLPPNARMDVDSAAKLLKLRDTVPQQAAQKSMQLWTIASQLREAIAGADVAPEAYMRLGYTFMRLARPEGGLVELGRAEKSSGTPFVRYMARYFGAVALERLGRHPEALQAYRGALEIVPRAQSATMALTSALFQQGNREEAVRLAQSSLMTPLANDPLKYYKAGDAADQWTARRAQLRKSLR
jgi:tetratricopeptide (TPR) repeat protein